MTFHNDTGFDYGLHFYDANMNPVRTVTFSDQISQVKRVYSVTANNDNRVMLLKRTNSATNAFQATLYDNSGNFVKDVVSGTNLFATALSNGNFAILSGDPASSLSMSIYDPNGSAVGTPINVGGPFGPVSAYDYEPTWPNPMLFPTADGRAILYDFSSTTKTARVKEYTNAGVLIKDWTAADSSESSQYGYTPYTLNPQPGFGVYNDISGDLVLYQVQSPTIIIHPADQTVTQGQSASFSVTAGGDEPLSYQWKKDGTNINGANAATFTIASAQSGDAGVYTVEVTNGGGSVTSNPATLVVNHKVTFDKNGGDTDASPATITVTHGGNVGTLPTEPTSAGHTFAGWNTAADGTGSAFTASTVVTANQTVYAQWSLNTYTVTFDKNGGDTDASPATITVTHGGNVGTLPTAPTRAHYTFAGWNTASNGSGSPFTAATTVTGNQNVYAQWAQITYTVSYVVGANGSISSTSEMVGSGGTPATVPAVTPDSGYVFAGWSSDGGVTKLTSAQVASTPVTAPITYIAYFMVDVPGVPNIHSATAGDGKVSLGWSPVAGATGYKIYQSVTSSTYGTEALTVTGSVYGADVTGLTNGTTYYFVVTAMNGSGESSASNQVSATPMTVPLAPTNVVATAGDGQATITFTPSTNNGGSAVTGYQVISSPGGIVVSGTTNTINVTGLTNGTSYTFTVKAINSAGSSPASAASAPVTPSAPATSTTGSTNSTGNQSQAVEILVNGKAVQNAGMATKTVRKEQTATTVVVDPQKIGEKLTAEGQGAVITIRVRTQSDVIVGELNGRLVKAMKQNEAVVVIKTENATFTLPAQLINIGALQDIDLQIEIGKPAADMMKVVENTAASGGFAIVVPPIEFTVKATSGNTTVEIPKFNGFVERTIAIPDGVDPHKITTGVVIEPDGTVRQVPTKIINVEGKYYAKISSPTNGTYSVVWNPREFKDVAGHWAKAAVNDLGSRMVISGITADLFQPDQDITRAEFAAIMVRGLGLKLESGNFPFSDVKPSDWFSSAVSTAHSYGLISGFEDGTFRPTAKITREQAMVIVAKAMRFTNLKAKIPAGSAEDWLKPYADSINISEWAKNGVADSISAGIVSGRNESLLAPKAYISRAEVAVLIQRLLQKSDLI
ncbi:InlB B-repeat-containing protein [Cohnella candidum]|uniref:InlB B-repeat-containing protein n=1 Tax=Cohnella candidum TaxID=2674991 RepID=UPI0013DE55DD|nr:InlB B-repeat-containing protein [Cohnella candidum]